MTADIRIEGDPSAGIPHGRISIDFGNCSAAVAEDRPFFREYLAAQFAELFDGDATVRFGDECPDCLRAGCKGECVVAVASVPVE